MPGLTSLSDALSGLQDQVTARLQAQSAFNGYTVRSETDGDIDDTVAKPTGKYSLLVTVALPDVTVGSRHNARRALLTIEIEEAVKTNRSKTIFKTARSLAMEAHNALCGWQPTGGWSAIEFIDTTTVTQKPTFIMQIRVAAQLQLT